ncbi:MAG: site-specific integrase [Bacteroidaceae bacterium]|nr:site-specific integrase [Bacteroidaceae bacterium]
MNVTFYIRKTNKEDEVGTVSYSFYVKREKVNRTTKLRVHEKDWDERRERLRRGAEHAADYNLILDKIAARITDVEVRFRLMNRNPTRETFMRALFRPCDYDNFFDYVDSIRARDARLGVSTRKTEKTVFDKLRQFRPGLAIEEIDRQFLDEFLAWLMKDRDNNLNTANKNISVLRKYVLAAKRDGYIDTDPFEGWRMPRRQPSVVFLTEEELQRLVEMYRDSNYDYLHHRALETFLFLCFSSLHIGDARQLTIEQYGDGTFTYRRKKLETRTMTDIIVPISEPMRTLTANMVGTRRRGPVIVGAPSDQAMNRALKDIADDARINKNLSLKVGRHTFATIFLRRTHDLLSLKSILGHADIKDTLVYAHVMDEDKRTGVHTAFGEFDV